MNIHLAFFVKSSNTSKLWRLALAKALYDKRKAKTWITDGCIVGNDASGLNISVWMLITSNLSAFLS